ncbi:MAG: hypothetical protein KKB62_00505, partial [Nanoarchaeota archaeon]|nr:hypothetical protein [Nanoarchaeota archaeon]
MNNQRSQGPLRGKKMLVLFFGMFLIGALVPMASAIDNFNISSSISSSPLFFLNGTTGDVNFGFNVTAGEDFCLETGLCLSSLDDLSGTLNSTSWNRSGTNVFLANTGDNVGIGTTGPVSKLHIGGAIPSQGEDYAEMSLGASVEAQRRVAISAFRSNTYSDFDAIGIAFKTHVSNDHLVAPVTTMVIDYNGNVGIGTTSPQEKLHVAGNSIFNGTINIDGNKIINLGNGTAAQHAVTFSQLQAVNTSAAVETDPYWTGNFTARTGTGNVVFSTSPTLVTPNIGAATAGGILNMSSNKIINLGNGTSAQDAVTLAQLQAVNVSAGVETDPYWTGNSTLVPYLASANTFTNNNVFNGNLTVDGTTFFVNSNTDRVGIGTTA